MRALIIAAMLSLSACATTPDLGEAKPVSVPALPPTLAERAKALPPLTDKSVKGQLEDAIATDRAYNDLAHRYNALVDLYECVRSAINDSKPCE